jgi:transposase
MSEAGARKPTYDELAAEVERLRGVVADLERQVRKTRKVAEEAERAGKRQASPFSKGEPTKEPKKPGRKEGKGFWANRARPEVVDETLRATLPSGCSCCGGGLVREKLVEQFQTELPKIRPIVRRFEIEVGRCTGCGRRVQARHAGQTSDAIGAAASQIGPNAIAQAAMLNKSYGLSWGKRLIRLPCTLHDHPTSW